MTIEKQIFKDVNIDLHNSLLSYGDMMGILRKVDKEHGSIMRICSKPPIYQIYTKEFIMFLNNIIEQIEGNRVLEVMAGDGKLSKFLSEFSTKNIIATDNKSWLSIDYPESVIKMDALKAVKYYKSDVVIICWEPYESEVSVDIIKEDIPVIWIGEGPGGCCGSEILFNRNDYYTINDYDLCVARTDYGFDDGLYCGKHTGIYLFNWPRKPNGIENENWW